MYGSKRRLAIDADMMSFSTMRLLLLSLLALALTFSNAFVLAPGGLKRNRAVSSSAIVSRLLAVTNNEQTANSDAFIEHYFSSSECDDINTPPSLSILLRSLDQLPSGSDIRGRFVDHSRVGSIANVAHAIGSSGGGIPPLTPIAAHCLGHAFARMLYEHSAGKDTLTVALGKDPRPHGCTLCDAFARGILSFDECHMNVDYTGLATTPAMFEFCRSQKCDGAVMVTASHLPVDRNGLKFFFPQGGFDKQDLVTLVEYAKQQAQYWHDQGILPPTSGKDAVFCTEYVSVLMIVSCA